MPPPDLNPGPVLSWEIFDVTLLVLKVAMVILLCLVCVVFVVGPRALHMVSMNSSTELQHQPHVLVL